MESSEAGQSAEATSTGRVARSTLIVMGGLGAALVVGLVRQSIVGNQFGTTAAFDAFAAANTIPELLYTMLSGGALAFAFIPVYSETLARGSNSDANRLLSHVFNAILLLTALASIVVALLAPWLVSAPWGVAPNFPPEVQRLTVQLMQILLLSTIIFAVSSILTGALHAHQHFLFPTFAPSVYSLGIILGAIYLAPSLGIFGLAWGAVIGACLHLLVQIPGLIIHRIHWLPAVSFTNPALRRVAVLMAPRVIDLLMARASIEWLNNNLASGMGEGRVSALRYSYTLMNMPWTLIGVAIGTAVFPTMAALAAQKDVNAQRRALSGSLRAILTLAIPAAVGLVVLGRPIIQVLFERGEFTPESTDLVYYALQFYAVTLLSLSMLEVVVRAFAAQEDTLTPLLVSFFTTALNIGLAIWLARPLLDGGLEHGGPPLANGIAVGIEALIGLTILGRRWGGVDARRIVIAAGKSIIAAGAMAVVVTGIRQILDPSPLIMLILGGGMGALVYFALALLLGIDEIRTVPLALLRQFNLGRPRGQAQA